MDEQVGGLEVFKDSLLIPIYTQRFVVTKVGVKLSFLIPGVRKQCRHENGVGDRVQDDPRQKINADRR